MLNVKDAEIWLFNVSVWLPTSKNSRMQFLSFFNYTYFNKSQTIFKFFSKCDI